MVLVLELVLLVWRPCLQWWQFRIGAGSAIIPAEITLTIILGVDVADVTIMVTEELAEVAVVHNVAEMGVPITEGHVGNLKGPIDPHQ
jgi:hypothetical protein